MVVEMVPLKGGISSIFHPPNEGKDYKWYISGIFPANWGMDYATDPTFWEPETTIEKVEWHFITLPCFAGLPALLVV